MKAYVLTVLLVLSSLVLFSQTDTAFYSGVSKGKITGVQKIWSNGNNEYHYSFYYNDRGRGDSTQTVIHTNDAGLITTLNITGVDYMKTPYAETFAIAGDSAVWTINGDKKAKKFDNQFYNLNAYVPAAFELLIQQMMKHPNRKIDLLPGGTMHCDEPFLKTISFNSKPVNLKLYAVYFDPAPEPVYVWMTEDNHLFAFVTGWFNVLPKGYETWGDSMYAVQETASQGYYENEVKKKSTPLPHHIAFTHANLFQSSTATVAKDMTVEVVDGKVTSVFASTSTQKLSRADTVIDCKGKFLMPGLWDMHAHYAKEEGVPYLAGGVTHIRDMGNEKILLTYKRQIADNLLLGPDISYLSGFIDKEDPFQGPTGTIVKSLDEALKAIDDYHRFGYQQIKIYSAIKPEWVAPMAARAHSYGMRVAGHIPAFMTATQAINAGYNEITHMNFIFLNFMGDTVDTRGPARFSLVGLNGGSLNLKSKEVQDLITLMKQKNIALDPTMNVWDEMFNTFKGDTSHVLAPIVNWLPAQMLPGIITEAPYANEHDAPVYHTSFNNMLNMLKLLYDNGIRIVAGTDGEEAKALHHELELYVQAGISANEVLKIATYNAALDCNLQDKYGEIKAGRDADLILIDGNPAKNISDIRRVELVIKNNKEYRPKELLAAQGWKYYY